MRVRTVFFLVKILDWSSRQSWHIFVFSIVSFQILWFGLVSLSSWFVDWFFSWFWGNIAHSSAETLSCWIYSWFGSRWCTRIWWALIRSGIIPKIEMVFCYQNCSDLFTQLCPGIQSCIWFLHINEECILGSRGRQLKGGKCDVILAIRQSPSNSSILASQSR